MKLIDREPTPEMLKAITGADCAPSNYKRMFQTAYDAAPEVNQDPVAIVDANDEGYWADILPDRSVKVGQPLFAYPPEAQDEIAKRDDLIVELKTLHENEAFNTKYFKLHYEELGKEFSKQAERIKELEEALVGYKADQAELIAWDVEQASEITRLKAVIGKCKEALEDCHQNINQERGFASEIKRDIEQTLAAIKEIEK